MKSTLKFTLAILLIFVIANLGAQDLSSFKNSDAFKFKGSIQLNGAFYDSDRKDRRSPYNWSISGSPTISVYGVDIPFSFSVRGQKNSFSQPFNRLGLSPNYKWAKVHIGYRSMNFSPYTMSGHTFLGVGLELNPGKIRFAAMYGDLQNTLIQNDTIVYGTELIEPYKRKAFSAKIGYGSDKNHFDFIVLKAKDDANSIDPQLSREKLLYPSENVVAGTAMKFNFFNKIELSANTAASLLTNNIFSDQEIELDDEDDLRYYDLVKKIITPNLTTRIFFAGDARVGINLNKLRLGFKYKYIDPFYQSMGTYYLQDDQENMTADLSLNFLNGKAVIRGSFGQQRNNLSGLRKFTTWRNIGSAFISYTPSSKYGGSITYSNYNTDQTSGFQEINDTVRFIQVSQLISFSPFYSFGSRDMKSRVSVTANYQVFDNQSLNELLNSNNETTTAYLNYSLRMKPKRITLGFSTNFNRADFAGKRTDRIGAGLSYKQEFLKKKLRLKARTNYSLTSIDGVEDGDIKSVRIDASYKLLKKHRLKIGLSYKDKGTTIQKGFKEFRGRVSYSFSW